MSVNTLFTLIGAFLIAVFVLFRPSDAIEETKEEVAQLELKDFRLYDVSAEGLKSILQASYGKKYTDRYEAADVNFSDTSKAQSISMQAKEALYKDEKIVLNKNVRYSQGEAFAFTADEAVYDQNRSLATTQGRFLVVYGDHRVAGEKLHYDAVAQQVKAEQIEGTFVLNN